MVKRISVLGATGSIGAQTLDLIDRAGGAEAFDVVALTGHSNIAALADAAMRLRADIAVTADPAGLEDLRAALAGSDVQAAAGPQAICEAAARPVDWTMSAIVGAAGLAPTLEAAKHGTAIALANKESMVCAGDLLNQLCTTHGTTLLPADSEHAAIFQCLRGERAAEVERVIITASGGPFRGRARAEMRDVTLAEAVAHPNWDMGQGISIDSATMFNKALEVIETREYFDVAPEQIEVLVHPESLVHALVGFKDGALMAHVGPPDMRHAIGFALHHPKRVELPVERLDLAKIGSFDFRAPDDIRWPALRLAREVMARGGMAGAVFNAAKETALDGFIAGQINFVQMAEIVEQTLDDMTEHSGLIHDTMTLDNVLQVDHLARKAAQAAINKRAG